MRDWARDTPNIPSDSLITYHYGMSDTIPANMRESSSSPEQVSGQRFHVEGMHCTSCAASLQEGLSKVTGIDAASVDFSSATAIVKTDIGTADILASIRAHGFEGSEIAVKENAFDTRSRIEESQRKSERLWKRRAIIGISIWLPLETLHWITHASSPLWTEWVMLIGSTIVMVTVGGGFVSSAWTAAKRRSTNMDTLITIGASTAYFWSLLVFIFQQLQFGNQEYWSLQPLYMAEAAALLGVISLGHWFEAKASARAGEAVRDLLSLQPDEAERLLADGTVQIVPSREISVGQTLQIRPGGRIPVDGDVIEGSTEVDESLLTGEPIPVLRSVGDSVIAGSMNTTGRICITATVDGKGTTVARIAELVQHAQSTKAPIQRLADVISSIFVPVVLGIAFATAVGWGVFMGDWPTAVSSTVSVLIISCPCALGLATPMAVMVGAGAASTRGILIKDASSLERAGRIQTILFDKTGTLTMGSPRVSSFERLDSSGTESDDAVIELAASVESPSEHPLGRAIVLEAERRGLSFGVPTNFEAIPGQGVKGIVGGKRIEVMRDDLASCRVSIDGVATATFTVEDMPRPDSMAAIASLRSMGIRVQMLTGDRKDAAEKIGKNLGLSSDDIIADATPESKQTTVAQSGPNVAMVGDGINDAAALASADLGIAMASGTGAAIETASIIVPEDRVSSVAEAIRLARKTLTCIRQNLFLAFVYNTTAIPLAAFGMLGMYGPLIAAAAMGLSDVSVIGNAIRLRRNLNRKDALSKN